MNIAEDIKSEIAAIRGRLNEITKALGDFIAENDNDAYSIRWPEWAVLLKKEDALLVEDLADAKRRLAAEEEIQGRRDEVRAREQAKAERAAAEEVRGAVEDADPRELWESVNAARAAAGHPSLAEAFIGSAHVRRAALNLLFFGK